MLMNMDNLTSYECTVLTPGAVELHWAEIRRLLTKAVAHGRGEVEVDDILPLVKSNKMFVAVLFKGPKIALAMAAEILEYPRKSILNVAFLGGEGLAPNSAMIDKFLVDLCKLLKLSAVRCFCRKSVARYLKRYLNFEDAYQAMEKRV